MYINRKESGTLSVPQAFPTCETALPGGRNPRSTACWIRPWACVQLHTACALWPILRAILTQRSQFPTAGSDLF